ncbi:histone H2B-like [Urocitellus parryii]|uniref:histone H2B-like n=1 Tax=Urocitellus parryii TaxID=9999 RepID=UPI000E559CFE|nr:histone H2B-like [Urocitellus parryii]
MAEEAVDVYPTPVLEKAKAMANLACDQSSEKSLNPREPQEPGLTHPPKEKKLRHRSRSGCKKSRTHSRSGESFATYFPKVLKHIHSGLILSRSTVSVLDSFVKDMFQCIASEASRLAGQNHHSTITSRDIQAAVRLLLPGEIGKHAVYEATRAINQSHPRQ